MRLPTVLSILLALAAAAAAAPAFAHAILIDSTPPPLGHVPAGRLAVTFRYNSRIDAARSKLTLRQNDRATRLAIIAAPTQDALQSSLDLTPGDYVLRWQVLATDGHITRGNVPFTVDALKTP